MNESDRKLILSLQNDNFELKRLYEEHVELERELEWYANKSYLTTQEEVKEKALKAKKLSGVDRMMSILDAHKAAA